LGGASLLAYAASRTGVLNMNSVVGVDNDGELTDGTLRNTQTTIFTTGSQAVNLMHFCEPHVDIVSFGGFECSGGAGVHACE